MRLLLSLFFVSLFLVSSVISQGTAIAAEVPSPATASSPAAYNGVMKKQDDKARGRWSLQDWIQLKEKMRWQDLWLAFHSPSLFEFFLGGAFLQSSVTATPGYYGWNVFGAAYVSIFGLEAQYESLDAQRAQGILHFRIFGMHAQATNWEFQFGLRHEDRGATAGNFRSIFVGTSLTFYFMKFFGIEGLYRHYFGLTPDAAGAIVSSDRVEGGAFLEFSLVRIFMDYVYEPYSFNVGGVPRFEGHSGFMAGLKIFL